MYKIFMTCLALLPSLVAAHQGEYDPTRPLSGTVSAEDMSKLPADFVLQSVIKDQQDGSRKAIVNGKLLAKGDRIAQFKVVSINDRSVTLQSPDVERKLSLFSQAVVNNK